MNYFYGRHNRSGSEDNSDYRGHNHTECDGNSLPDSRSRYCSSEYDEQEHLHYHGRGNRLENPAHKQTHKIYTKAGEGFSVAVRENKVVLVQSDDHHDTQHWYKDERWFVSEGKYEGHHCFALVNKATGQVIRHSVPGEPVTLVPYDPEDGLELSMLWTESEDVGEGFKNIRVVNDIKLCMDAFHGDKDHGGVRDGTHIALYECWNGENQQWKIVPCYACEEEVVEEDPNDLVLETPLRKTLEQVVRELDEEEEQRKGEDCHAEPWEMINFGIVGQQQQQQSEEKSVPQSIQLEQLVRQRLGKMVLNPLLETRSKDNIFIPQWEITSDDCLTDAFSERSIALCHQWCKEIVPPMDHKELLSLGLKELYHWADYHKAQAHIFEMTAREKANSMFLNEQALREAAEKRILESGEERSGKITALSEAEAVEKLEQEKAELAEKLRAVEMKCLEQEGRLKEQANSFETQLRELKIAAAHAHAHAHAHAQTSDEGQESLCVLKHTIPQLLKKKMEIVIKAIMKRHQDLDWVSIFEDIDRMEANLNPISQSMTATL